MKEKIAKLIDVKSIMTLMLTLVFCYLALAKVISGQEFLTIFTVIVGFYFGTQYQKATQQTAGVVYKATVAEVLPEQADAVVEQVVTEATVNKQLQPPDEDKIVGYKY